MTILCPKCRKPIGNQAVGCNVVEIDVPCRHCGKESSLEEIGKFNCGATVPAPKDWRTETCGTCGFRDAEPLRSCRTCMWEGLGGTLRPCVHKDGPCIGDRAHWQLRSGCTVRNCRRFPATEEREDNCPACAEWAERRGE